MWSYDICLLLSDISFSMLIGRSIHAAANGIISFYFYGLVVFHYVYIYLYTYLFLYLYIDVYTYMHHIFFIHLSIDGIYVVFMS